MSYGDDFRKACERAVTELCAEPTADPEQVNRARRWQEYAPDLIDAEEPDRALLSILSTHANLSDQHSIRLQTVIVACTKWVVAGLSLNTFLLLLILWRIW